MTTVRIAVSALLGASVIFLAAACGSSSNTTTTSPAAAATAWAGGVCLVFSQFHQDLDQAASEFKANPTKDQLFQSVNALETAANKGREQLKGIGPPPAETQTGRQAIDTLRSQIKDELDAIDSLMKNVSSTDEAKAAAPQVRAEVEKMKTSFQTAVTTVKSLPSGVLAQGFKDAPNCQSLGS